MPILQSAPEIKRVVFDRATKRDELRHFLGHSLFKQIESVSIRCDMEDIPNPLRGLSNCASLKELRLRYIMLSKTEGEEILQCRQLETIELWETEISDECLELLADLPKLKLLVLIGEEVSPETIEAIARRDIQIDQ